jgi:hypothetical protein
MFSLLRKRLSLLLLLLLAAQEVEAKRKNHACADKARNDVKHNQVVRRVAELDCCAVAICCAIQWHVANELIFLHSKLNGPGSRNGVPDPGRRNSVLKGVQQIQ